MRKASNTGMLVEDQKSIDLREQSFAEAKIRFNKSMRDFIFTELEVGVTFASAALDSENPEKRQRNQNYACKAYSTALRFRNKHPGFDPDEQQKFLVRIGKLQKMLIRLGQTIEE